MKTDRDLMLESVAEAVADGLPVDWDGLQAIEPQAAEQLKLLRLCQDILSAHRAVVTPPTDEPASG